MKIHFVCTSNTFRSRLANTYLKSKNIPNLIVTSSGIDARENPNGPITWYAQDIIEKNGLTDYKSESWTQITKEILENQDLIVFMKKWHYNKAVEKFGFKGTNYEIWDIEDIKTPKPKPDLETITQANEIYKNLVKKIETLFIKTSSPSTKRS